MRNGGACGAHGGDFVAHDSVFYACDGRCAADERLRRGAPRIGAAVAVIGARQRAS